MSTDYFNTLPSGYIEYIDKIMKNLVVGSHKAPEWSDDWDIRLDSLDGTPIFSINGDSTYPIYRINYNPAALLFNMVPMGGEGEQLEFIVQVYDKYNIERLVYDFFERKNQDVEILGKKKGFNRWTPFNL
jgi:hypothetical protein